MEMFEFFLPKRSSVFCSICKHGYEIQYAASDVVKLLKRCVTATGQVCLQLLGDALLADCGNTSERHI